MLGGAVLTQTASHLDAEAEAGSNFGGREELVRFPNPLPPGHPDTEAEAAGGTWEIHHSDRLSITRQ